MKMSECKQTELYAAITEPITDLRIEFLRNGIQRPNSLDSNLYDLNKDIWARVHKALNLEGAP